MIRELSTCSRISMIRTLNCVDIIDNDIRGGKQWLRNTKLGAIKWCLTHL